MLKKGYGQFCPVAKASEIIAERWTLLVLRELLSGSHRFNHIRRGVPLMSVSLLALRLKQLELAGMVQRVTAEDDRNARYLPTEACEALRPIIEAIGSWGLQFVQPHFDQNDLDPSLLMWDVRRCIQPGYLPRERVTIQFEFPDQPANRRHWWLLKEQESQDIDLCLHDPGFEIDLYVTASMDTMARVWLGDQEIASALRSHDLELAGASVLRISFVDWIGLSTFARVSA